MTRRDFLTPGLRLVLLLPVIPTFVLVLVVMSVDEDTGPVAMAVTIVLLLALIIVEQIMHAFITLREDSVRMGFLPIFWRTIPYRTIASVDPVRIDPMRDYGGWGIKGKSRSEKGLLFSGGGHHGVMITTLDGRRYVATSREPMHDLVETLREMSGRREHL